MADDKSSADVFAAYPDAFIDPHTVVHFRARLQRRLLVDRCEECGRWHNPPRPMCPDCWSMAVRPTEVSGRGVIDLLTRVYIGPPAEGINYAKGHLIGAVSLAEQPGLRISGAIVAADPGSVKIGMDACLTWIVRGQGGPIPAFAV